MAQRRKPPGRGRTTAPRGKPPGRGRTTAPRGQPPGRGRTTAPRGQPPGRGRTTAPRAAPAPQPDSPPGRYRLPSKVKVGIFAVLTVLWVVGMIVAITGIGG